MQLSATLRSPLDQYVDDYFSSKVNDLASAFNLPEPEVVHVLEFGCRQIKRAPSRRSSSQESDPEPGLSPAVAQPVAPQPPRKKSRLQKPRP